MPRDTHHIGKSKGLAIKNGRKINNTIAFQKTIQTIA
jgi:hypothetical protein